VCSNDHPSESRGMSLLGLENPPFDPEKSPLGDKDVSKGARVDSAHDSNSNIGVLDTEQDIVTHIISVHDDPTLNPWTIRAFIIGLILSAFGGVLGKAICPSPYSSGG